MIVGIIFAVLIVGYLIFFSKASVVNWLIKNHFVGKESKPILLKLDKPFLDTWKRAAEAGLQRFNYGNITGYNTKVGQVLNATYGKTS
jgi:hypothetical protein